MTTSQLIQRRTITDTGCWNYTGAITGGKCGGYGNVKYNGKTISVHRLSYSLFVGDLIPGLVVEHTCENRACFNPHHLQQVTQKKNLERGVKSGTVKWAKKVNQNQK